MSTMILQVTAKTVIWFSYSRTENDSYPQFLLIRVLMMREYKQFDGNIDNLVEVRDYLDYVQCMIAEIRKHYDI